MDGYEATRQIRASALPGSGTIPIIAMTANVFKEDVERCLAAGMNEHLGKPILVDEMMRVLKKYLL
jgi:CheY-like chemotaxis protein